MSYVAVLRSVWRHHGQRYTMALRRRNHLHRLRNALTHVQRTNQYVKLKLLSLLLMF